MPGLLDAIIEMLKGKPGEINSPNMSDKREMDRMGSTMPPIELGPIIAQRSAQAAPPPTIPPAPISQPMSQQPVAPQPQNSQGGFDISKLLPPQYRPDAQGNPGAETGLGALLRAIGLPLASTGIGLAAPGALPGAAGFNTGFAAEQSKGRDRDLEEGKLKFQAKREQKKEDKAKVDEAYKMAVELSKTGPMGAIKELTPQQIDDLAKRIYEIKSRTTEEITSDVKNKQETKPSSAPDKSGYKEGDIRTINGVNFVRDKNGNWNQSN